MMKKPHAGEGHDDAVLVAFLDDQVVPDGADLLNMKHARLMIHLINQSGMLYAAAAL